MKLRDLILWFSGSHQNVLSQDSKSCTVSFAPHWRVLGPFQIGTREAVWGADPLERAGGFRALEFNASATYRSSLASNGNVHWSTIESHKTISCHQTQSHVESSAAVRIDFPDIGWDSLNRVYGWAAFQWQAWARGEILIQGNEVQSLNLHVHAILELWINGDHYYGGDFYSYSRAPITIRLGPGKHRVDVRLVRDVRSMGSVGDPSLDVKLRLQQAEGGLRQVRHGILEQSGNDFLISDIVTIRGNGVLTSSHASVTLHNEDPTTIELLGIVPLSSGCIGADLVSRASLFLVAGQTRPVAFKIDCPGPFDAKIPLRFNLRWKRALQCEVNTLNIQAFLVVRDIQEEQRVTFMHPAGVVSYALIRPPPSSHSHCRGELPVLIALHGAGVEADSDLMRHAFDALPTLCTWLLFPSGGTPWSGDDWHQWGLADVEAAVSAIALWILQVNWDGPRVDTGRWLVTGHSNGGQATWYLLTHRSDKVIAAAALSGYSSIQKYVPYVFWHTCDPGRMAIVQASLSSYDHPLLLSNALGIPIFQQHGSMDDNVPAYHSRLLSQSLLESGAESTYSEVLGGGHYWEGVMTTKRLVQFYQRHLVDAFKSPHTYNFTLVTANPGDTGSKNGIEILQLTLPGQIGKLRFYFDPLSRQCSIRTSNLLSFRLPLSLSICKVLTVDRQIMEEIVGVFERQDEQWKFEASLLPSASRAGRQLGPLDAFLRTNSSFEIVIHSADVWAIGLQISHNLCQYLGADTELLDDYARARAANGNIVSLAVGNDLPAVIHGHSHAIKIVGGRLEVLGPDEKLRRWDEETAAIFLRPIPLGRLEMVVWGSNLDMVRLAARLIPIIPGSGVPDFVIASRSLLWKGLDGVIAMGFLDANWEVSRNSFVQD